jgi:hypothetical protein
MGPTGILTSLICKVRAGRIGICKRAVLCILAFETEAMDLTTNYLGLSLRSPLVPSASPLSEKIDNVSAMEQAGAAAVVFYSLFEEEIDAVAPECRVGPRTTNFKPLANGEHLSLDDRSGIAP